MGGHSLNYIIRDTEAVPPVADQPMLGTPDTPLSSIRDEVSVRITLHGPHTATDHARVFELLQNAVFEHKKVYLQLKLYVHNKSGRDTWVALKAHYLGAAARTAAATQ